MISPEWIEEVANWLERQGIGSADWLKQLRQNYPQCHFTYCLEDEIVDTVPVLERADFNVYLVDGQGHCLQLTQSYEVATGVVLAEKTVERS